MEISSTYHIIIPVLIPLECPACHMHYDLAKGGSIHFQCTRCPNEFCSGCGVSFKNPKVWKTFDISGFCKCCQHDVGALSWLNAETVERRKSTHPPLWQTCKVLRPWALFRLRIQPVKKFYIHVHSFLVHSLQDQRKPQLLY